MVIGLVVRTSLGNRSSVRKSERRNFKSESTFPSQDVNQIRSELDSLIRTEKGQS